MGSLEGFDGLCHCRKARITYDAGDPPELADTGDETTVPAMEPRHANVTLFDVGRELSPPSLTALQRQLNYKSAELSLQLLEASEIGA
jgi:hypothetical protein